MLETALVTTIGLPGSVVSSSPTEDSWDCEDPSKFSAIKLECPDSFDTMMLSQTSATDLAELKPLPFDYGPSPDDNSSLILSENNNCSSSKDLNQIVRSSASFYSGDVSSTILTPRCSPAVVTTTTASSSSSSNSSSPLSSNNSIKLELDFTASQDAFDDLASIVGISMGADSTVPNLDSSDIGAQEWSDLDAWIENTAQEIKPLEPGSSESHLGTTTILRSNSLNPSSSSQQPFIIGSTLHSLLTSGGPSKMTQLQQRDICLNASSSSSSSNSSSLLPPPPYSILQNRLQHGASGGKVEINNVGVSSFYGGDSLPHSTSSPLLPCEDSQGHSLRRSISLGEIKAKKSSGSSSNKLSGRVKLNSSSSSASSSSSNSSSSSSPNPVVDPSKKMMHHCHICNRGFLNKSNIKVHLRTHTGEKPFKCEHCSKAFRQKAHLLKHMSIHKRISRD